MLIRGVKEWYGDDARKFMDVRNKIEETFVDFGLEFLYTGSLSNARIYQKYRHDLGVDFFNNFVYVDLKDKDKGMIVSPEATYRVYEYAVRHKMNKGKICYSQEFLRNESPEQLEEGKTRSFWQAGFELFGYPIFESGIESINIVMKSIQAAGVKNAYCRMGDKRSLLGLLQDISMEQKLNIYRAIEDALDDGEKFAQIYLERGGDVGIAERVRKLLVIDTDNETAFQQMEEVANNSLSHEGLTSLRAVYNRLIEKNSWEIKIVPFMAKSWDACHALIYDVRVPDYEYAIGSGGNLSTCNDILDVPKSGGGIGITRITEYLLSKAN